MKYIYTALLKPRLSGGYECQVPDIPHCVSSGKNLEDALIMIADAASMMLVIYEDENRTIPTASIPGSFKCGDGVISTLLLLDTEAYRTNHDGESIPKSA